MASNADSCDSCKDNFVVNSKYIECSICEGRYHTVCVSVKDSWLKLFSDWSREQQLASEIAALKKEIAFLTHEKNLSSKMIEQLEYTNNLQKSVIDSHHQQAAHSTMNSVMLPSRSTASSTLSFSDAVKKIPNRSSVLLIKSDSNSGNNDILRDVTTSVNPAEIDVCINNTHKIRNGIAVYCQDEKSLTFRLVDISTVLDAIRSIKSNSSGIDGITIEMIKLCLPAVGIYILHLINCCLERGVFPIAWKEALVQPLPKIPNPQVPGDLRPISLLSALSKILEKIVYMQLNEYLLERSILPLNQSGFRKGHSTTTALARVCDDVLTAADRQEATALVLLDFSKAFDILNHKLLVSKCEYIGCDDLVLEWIDCYLNERHQYVVIQNKLSDKRPICSGVPQGSILGPLLFLIYTFDISNTLQHCSGQSYADDMQVFHNFCPNNYHLANNLINHICCKT
ncbi:unnamed protein product [Acanthoscelides obtectus]|uniref:Reverse transcriptase domain-containing protein n=1 Tax=Acanthoscelides obtectus TaxID=200917 RepID=A0A9P0Q0N4_ACAOB|nr:unnamed protein product [Acanthoscelides obtectus]CAK1664159.1 Probable RNA-directed DNA polymerase from transposon BS [Acanthoscelides obtectus]